MKLIRMYFINLEMYLRSVNYKASCRGDKGKGKKCVALLQGRRASLIKSFVYVSVSHGGNAYFSTFGKVSLSAVGSTYYFREGTPVD
jgi:hypothetical protein